MKKTFLYLALCFHVCAAYTQDGSLDQSFANGGMLTMDIDNSNDVIRAVTTQPDGKIIAVGYKSNSNADAFCMLRFLSDGTLDSSFGTDGIVVTAFPFTSLASDVGLQDDGKILLAGHTWAGEENNFALARYNPDGSPDTTFGNSGTVVTSFGVLNIIGRKLQIQDDGKIVVGGLSYTLNNDDDNFAMARYNTNGTLDTTFGNNGFVITSFGPGTQSWINDFQLQDDGKIVAGGFTDYFMSLARYNVDGTLDVAFGTNGLVSTVVPNSVQSLISAVAIDESGAIYGGGFSVDGFSDFTMVKYDSNGDLDLGFGEDGILVNQMSYEQDAIQDIQIQADGKLLIGGNSNESGVWHFALARFDSNGAPDNSFGTGGVVKTLLSSDFNQLNSLSLQQDGNILAAGYVGQFPYDIGIARYSSASLSAGDPMSTVGNVVVFPNPASNEVSISFVVGEDSAYSLRVIDANGKLLQQESILGAIPQVLSTKTFDLSAYPSGLYLMQLTSKSGIQSFPFMKQ